MKKIRKNIKELALITGATSGIGRAIADELAARGWSIIAASRNMTAMKTLKKELEAQYGITVHTYRADFSRPGADVKLFEAIQKDRHKITALVNNAGIGLPATIMTEQNQAEAEALFSINCTAVFRLSMLFGRDMQKRKYGRILNVSSTAAFQPMPVSALYGATKAFVLSYSEAMAMELKKHGVTVTALCPGLTETAFFRFGKPRAPGWLYPMMRPEFVASRAVKGMLAGKMTVIPGLRPHAFTLLPRILPRPLTARLMVLIEYFRKQKSTKSKSRKQR